MFFGHISQYEEKIYPKALRIALNFLKNTDFNQLEVGLYPIKEDKIFVQVLDIDTKAKNELLPEIHHKYIDVQYLHRGEELMGYAPDFANNEISSAYNEERDILFYKDAEGESFFLMQEGSFAIFFPNEIHRPAICLNEKPSKIRKIVVKVAMSEITEGI